MRLNLSRVTLGFQNTLSDWNDKLPARLEAVDPVIDGAGWMCIELMQQVLSVRRRFYFQCTEFEFRNLAVGVECFVRQQVCGSFMVTKRHEHLSWAQSVVETGQAFNRTAARRQPDPIAWTRLNPLQVIRVD